MAGLHLSPLVLFLAQLAVIVTVSRLIGIGLRRLGQPLVIAEIIAGIAIGPSLFGWLWPEGQAALFPPASVPALGLTSQLGLVLFMFLVGLELDPRLLHGRRKASAAIGLGGIVIPFALGVALAVPLHGSLAPAGVPFGTFALFLGAAMSITAFPVLARILAERRLMRTSLGALTMACAAVGDVAAWCILAFIVSVAGATGMVEAIVTTGLALTYIAAMFFGARPLLRRMGARAATPDGVTQDLVAATFLLLFASAAATELIGVHALFGAFLLGVIMPRDGGLPEALSEKVEDFVVVMLLPLFFAYSGLRTRIGSLDDASEWALAGAIIAVACVGKIGGSVVVARFTGMAWRESAALGVLMNTRGLMELIVLNIGLDLGIITTELFTMMVLMALTTTFMATPLLQWIKPRAGEPVERVRPPGFSMLMCVSNPAIGPAMSALAAAVRAPTKSRHLALRLLAPERPSVYMRGGTEEQAELALQPLLLRAKALQLDVAPMAFVSASPAPDICRTAAANSADLVLLGRHKPLLGTDVFGGIVREVVGRATTDVGILVDRGLEAIRRVLVVRRGGPDDEAAEAIGRRMSGEVVVVWAARDEDVVAAAGRGFDLVVVGFEPEGLDTLVAESPASILAVHRPVG